MISKKRYNNNFVLDKVVIANVLAYVMVLFISIYNLLARRHFR